MSNANSLYDAPTREIYLLENVAIQGRKTELRQLLKLLNLAKTGQPKAALITGDAGIGKTALLETFTSLVYEGVYCRVLDMGKMTLQSPEEVYVSLIEKLQAEANDILDEALVAVNEITHELDLRWERQDLVRAIALVKLQESIGGKEAISQEQLVKAIRSQVPAVKKLKFSVNESIEKLVDLIVNPWVMVATSLLNPMSPPLQEAIKLAETLRDNNFSLPDEAKLSQLLNEPRPAVHPAPEPVSAREPFPPISDPEVIERGGTESLKSLPTIIDTEFGVIFEEGVRPIGETDFQSTSLVPTHHPTTSHASSSLSSGSASYTPARAEIPAKPIKDPLIKHLMTVFNFVNATIENIDSALLLIIDEWDRIQHTPQQNELKEFFSELLYQITEQKNYHFMAVIAARTEGESYTLGGAMYNHFRTKLLLDALNESACRKLIRNPLKDIGVELDEEVNHRIFKLSKGNPFWQLKIGTYMKERVEGNRLRHVDMNFFDKLGIDQVNSLFELSFTRLKLTFLNDEESLYKVIAALIKLFGEERFSANRAIKEISASQGFTDGYVFEVLRALFRHDFIRQVEISHQERRKTDGRALEDRSRKHDPYYTIQSRFILEFLKEKTRTIETDISTDEKIMYLKKVIPLSVKSGDLDREKTMEVLALGDAMGNGELVTFLEDIFIEYLHDDKPVVRVTALNNIALIDSQRAREALFNTIRDRDSMVREYAARNLSMLSQKSSSDPNLASKIIDAMLQAIDDESEAVRAQVYTTISKYRWHRDLTSVFIKGMSDACDAVRLTSIKNLADADIESPYIFTTLMDAIKDTLPDVRRYACIGLQRFPGAESIEAIVRILQTDTDSAIRALAADSLSRMEDNKAFIALVNALRKEAAEDVKLAVVRALGKRRGWQTEAVLQEALQSADWEHMPVFTWACVRSLGQVGGTERSLGLLKELKGRVKNQNQIINSAIELAIQRISEHIEELHQMERQLEEATPIAVAIPSEYAEEVQIPEEEKIPDQELLAYGSEDEPEVSGLYENDELREPINEERPKMAARNGSQRAQSLLKLPFEK